MELDKTLPEHVRCEHCAASVPAGAPWCTLCLTPLRAETPEPALEPAPVHAVPGPTAELDPLTAPLELLLVGKHVAPESVQELLAASAAAPTPAPGAPAPEQPAASPPAGPAWPCASCGHPNALEREACAACGAGFLEAVRLQEPPLLALPGVGDVGRLSRGQQLLLACSVPALLGMLLLVLGALLG